MRKREAVRRGSNVGEREGGDDGKAPYVNRNPYIFLYNSDANACARVCEVGPPRGMKGSILLTVSVERKTEGKRRSAKYIPKGTKKTSELGILY